MTDRHNTNSGDEISPSNSLDRFKTASYLTGNKIFVQPKDKFNQ